jgi:hypothetical protein
MKKRIRTIQQMFAAHRVTILEHKINGHLKFRVRNEQGIERNLVFAASSSDINVVHQQERQIRRFAEEGRE